MVDPVLSVNDHLVTIGWHKHLNAVFLLFFSCMLIKFYRCFLNNYATASTKNVKIISYN